MGQAKKRGSLEERIVQAQERDEQLRIRREELRAQREHERRIALETMNTEERVAFLKKELKGNQLAIMMNVLANSGTPHRRMR